MAGASRQVQIILSLGATKTDYSIVHGDVAVFGSSLHSVPVEDRVTEPRISIALFLLPIIIYIHI